MRVYNEALLLNLCGSVWDCDFVDNKCDFKPNYII